VGFGSYHSFPVLAAAWLRRIPVVLYEANTVPGKVIRCFSQYAKVTGLHFDEAAKYLKGKSIELGMPLREGYNSLSLSSNRARQQLGLDSNKFTFLVFGGSQGAFNINLLICSAIVHNLAERSTNYQVIHLVGAQSEVETFKEQYENANIQCLVKGFEPEMNVVWRASDLAICRAGAGTIAELIEMEVPAILIPYPYAADQHQDKNADVLVEQIRGGIKFNERGTDAGVLATEISNLIVNERQLLNQMRYNIKQYKQKKVKRRDLCSVVCEVAGIKER
jgi:UDP-N-acetylglucosamine--N-acetylmuramyl-(pentapeptide) pyrophosphoryl-undecaprenol N-acetylglucosamine transferase